MRNISYVLGRLVYKCCPMVCLYDISVLTKLKLKYIRIPKPFVYMKLCEHGTCYKNGGPIQYQHLSLKFQFEMFKSRINLVQMDMSQDYLDTTYSWVLGVPQSTLHQSHGVEENYSSFSFQI